MLDKNESSSFGDKEVGFPSMVYIEAKDERNKKELTIISRRDGWRNEWHITLYY